MEDNPPTQRSHRRLLIPSLDDLLTPQDDINTPSISLTFYEYDCNDVRCLG